MTAYQRMAEMLRQAEADWRAAHPPATDTSTTDTPGESVHVPDRTLARFATGAVRSTDADGERWDLITPIGLRRLAETCAEGSRKYGEYNWTKGIPASVMLNHAIRHLYLYLAGDRGEDHLAHAAWNILGVCHFEEALPEMIDIPARKAPERKE